MSYSSNTLYKVERNSYVINTVFTLIRGIQILCWSLSLIILSVSINKTQKIKHEQELRIMMSGCSNIMRISMLLSESFLLMFLSLALCSSVLYPVVKLQTVFGITLYFSPKLIFDLSLYATTIFLVITSIIYVADNECLLSLLVSS